MTEYELDEILTLYWPRVLRQVMAPEGNEWERGFALSIARAGKRPGWRPTPKQESIMRRMVAELFTHTQEEGELHLIE